MSLLAQSVDGLVPLDQTIEVLAPEIIANPHLTGQTTRDWANASVTATVKGRLAPASTRALERVGRVGMVGVLELLTEPTTITPLGHVRVGSQHYLVLDARPYRERTHAIIEAVDVQEASS